MWYKFMWYRKGTRKETCKCLKYLARLEGIEPSTKSLEGSCSIRLSYRRTVASL